MLNLRKTKLEHNHRLWSRKSRLAMGALCVTCAALLGLGIWPLKLLQIGHAGQQSVVKLEFDAKQVKDQMQRGLGRQVRFASPGDSLETVSASVWQVDRFIYERSGLKMSPQTRERLTAMESSAVSKEGHRIGLDELTDALTETAVERMSTLTDQDIEDSRKTFLGDAQIIHTRANGGSLLAPERFMDQAKALRYGAQRQDKLLRSGAHDFIAAEIKSRADLLGGALPETFGRVAKEGVTPLQAVVFSYAVASDDPLTGSQSELQESVSLRNQGKGKESAKGSPPERAYGTNGRIFSTPLSVVFNTKTFNSLLDRIEKGGAK